MDDSFDARWKALSNRLGEVMGEMLALAVERHGPTGAVPFEEHTLRLSAMTAVPDEWLRESHRGCGPSVFMPWSELHFGLTVVQEKRHIEKVDGKLVPGPSVMVVAGIVTEDQPDLARLVREGKKAVFKP